MKTHKPCFALIKEKINAARKIVIAGHTGPDFDDVGSCLALYEVLRAMHKDVVIASDFHESIWREAVASKPLGFVQGKPLGFVLRPIRYTQGRPEEFEGRQTQDDGERSRTIARDRLSFPSASLGARNKMSSFASYKPDLVFLLDYGKEEKIDASVRQLIEQTKPFVITIDHHAYQSQFGNIVWIDSEFVSTTEMLHMLFSKIKARIPEQANYYLLLGVWGDTGAFAYQRVSKRLLRMVNALVTHGDEIRRIMEVLHQKMDADEFCLYGKLLAGISYDESLGLAACISRKQIPEGMNRAVLHEMRRIRGLRVMLFLKRFTKTGYWKVSVWGTQHNTLDLNKFARQFDGGGHFNAAGFKTKLSSVTIIQRVKQAIKKKRPS